MIDTELKYLIKKITVNSIIRYAKAKIKQGVDTYHLLDILIPEQRKIRSIVGGLEGSLGKTLWEPLAKEIAKTNGFKVVNANLFAPNQMPDILSNTMSNIINDRLNQMKVYDGITSRKEIIRICQQYEANPILQFRKAPSGFGVDIWLNKHGVDFFFDTKTVQPNKGDLVKYFRQIIAWYGYYYSQYPKGNAECRIVFPFNPYKGDFWKNTRDGGRPLEKGKEAWVENDFWNFISGHQNGIGIIKESFDEIHKEKTLKKQLKKLFQ